MRHISYAPTYHYLHVYKEFKISANIIKVNRVSRYSIDKSFIYQPHQKIGHVWNYSGPTKMEQNEQNTGYID